MSPPKEIAIPAELLEEKARSITRTCLRSSPNYDDDLMMKVLEGKEPTVDEIKKAHPQSHDHREVLPGLLRHRVQG
jgi:translation elongation factor EF-G